MKALKILAALVLVASIGLNVWFWQQRAEQLAANEAARANATEAEALRMENETLKTRSAAQPASSEESARELARLRNEVGQLRKQAAETESLRGQAAEAAQLRSQLTAAKKSLSTAEGELAEAAKLTPEEVVALKGEAHATTCVSNLKQIGLAAHLYAQEHGNLFPPDLITMKDQLATPKTLFCPAAPGGVQANDWTQLNPSTNSYQFLNPNGNKTDAQKPLSMCPIHGHVVYSDASVQRGKK